MDKPTVRAPHALALGLFVLVWLSCSWFGSWELNPNNATRLFAAISLAEQHDATIDEFQMRTIDKAKFGDHYYADKAPGMSLMAVPAVWIADAVTGQRAGGGMVQPNEVQIGNYLRLRLRLAVAMTAAVLTAFAAVLLLDLAVGITGNVQAGFAAALAYALGSPVWGWSTTLFGHAPVAALLLVATWAVWRGTSGPLEFGRWRYPVMAGAALGWAVVIEFPAALPGLVIGVWALWRTRDLALPACARIVGLAVLAGIAALVPLALYNQLAFGTPLKLGYQGVVGFEGMEQGLFGLTYPKIEVLAQIVAGPDRGLVWVAPILVLAPIGLRRLIRTPETRDLGWLATGLVTLVLLYNASYFYWDGGHSTGPRHSVPALGFLALGIAPLWASWGISGRRWISGLLALSLFINLAIAAAEITAPHGYHFPVVAPVMTRFFSGIIRDLPGEYWGWPPLAGLAQYLAVALPLLGWLLRRATNPSGVP